MCNLSGLRCPSTRMIPASLWRSTPLLRNHSRTRPGHCESRIFIRRQHQHGCHWTSNNTRPCLHSRDFGASRFNPCLTLGSEICAAVSDNDGLGKVEFQGLVGGQFGLRKGLAFTFALPGGRDAASPRIGGQIGFEVDFPTGLHRSAAMRHAAKPPSASAPQTRSQ